MGTYTFRNIETHQVRRIFSLVFDTADQKLWSEMLSIVKIMNPEVSFPDQAPTDPEVWHRLLKHVPDDELGDVEEDWWMMEKGGFDVNHETLNDKGHLLFED